MKLKTKKTLVVLSGILLSGNVAVQELSAASNAQKPEVQMLCPINDTEELIISGFAKDIPLHDKRCFNQIIDEVLYLINNNYDYFKGELTKRKVANPDSIMQEFIGMLAGLKTKSKVNDILSDLNKYKPVFNMITPRVMSELFRYPLKTLKNLKERHKRNP